MLWTRSPGKKDLERALTYVGKKTVWMEFMHLTRLGFGPHRQEFLTVSHTITVLTKAAFAHAGCSQCTTNTHAWANLRVNVMANEDFYIPPDVKTNDRKMSKWLPSFFLKVSIYYVVCSHLIHLFGNTYWWNRSPCCRMHWVLRTLANAWALCMGSTNPSWAVFFTTNHS